MSRKVPNTANRRFPWKRRFGIYEVWNYFTINCCIFEVRSAITFSSVECIRKTRVLLRSRLKIPISNRYDFICSKAQIVLFRNFHIMLWKPTLFPIISESFEADLRCIISIFHQNKPSRVFISSAISACACSSEAVSSANCERSSSCAAFISLSCSCSSLAISDRLISSSCSNVST